jgi:hypothetical protein
MKITVCCNVCNEDRGVRPSEFDIRNYIVNLKKAACLVMICICCYISEYKGTQLSTSRHWVLACATSTSNFRHSGSEGRKSTAVLLWFGTKHVLKSHTCKANLWKYVKTVQRNTENHKSELYHFLTKVRMEQSNIWATNCVLEVLCTEIGSSIGICLTGRCACPDFSILYLRVDELCDEICLCMWWEAMSFDPSGA